MSANRLVKNQHPVLHGFTLVELLVVITIIGILIALLLPAVQSAREAARRMQCANGAKQMGLAVNTYISGHNVLPPGEMDRPSGSNSGTGQNWATAILPYLEQQGIYDQLDFKYPTYNYPDVVGPRNHQAAMCNTITAYRCPSSAHANFFGYDSGRTPNSLGFSVSDYGILEFVGIAGSDRYGKPSGYPSKDGAFFYNSAIEPARFTDGLSNTMIIGEYSGTAPGQNYASNGALPDNDTTWGMGHFYGSLNSGNYGGYADAITYPVRTVAHPPNTAWYSPSGYTTSYDPPLAFSVARAALKSSHPGGIHVTMGDGSVHFVGNAIDLTVFKDLADRNDGHPLGAF